MPYRFVSSDQLIVDFFDAVERACKLEGMEFEFDHDEVELDTQIEAEDDDDAKVTE